MSTTRTVLQERLINIVRRFGDRRALVVGDAIADQFVYGAISRVSREAPVFILSHEQTETIPGGAANCAINLVALGARVSLIAVVGDDAAGRALVEKLEAAGVDCGGILVLPQLQTTTKVRILAGQLHSTRQQVIRIDYDGNAAHDQDVQTQLRDKIGEYGSDSDALIISDYNYGVANKAMSKAIEDVVNRASDFESEGRGRIPVLVDSRFKLSDFTGFTSATPNQDEVEHLLGRQLKNSSELELAGEQMRERLGYRALLVTRGSQGMVLFESGVAPIYINAVGARDPVDVTGAGDTVIATYALAIASDASFQDAARLANYAGSLVVMKRGTSSISTEELEHSILHSE